MGILKVVSILILLAGMIAILTNCAAIDFTPRPWTNGEKVAAGVFIAAHGANWYSTHRHQSFENITEMNPVLGDKPSETEIASYFIIGGLVGLGVAHYMPEHRYWILGGYAATNIYFTFHDMRLIENMRAHGVN